MGHWSAFDSVQREYWYDRARKIIEFLDDKFKRYDTMIVSDHGRPINDDQEKHTKKGVFAFKGRGRLKSRVIDQYDFLPTVLSYFNIKYNLRGGNLL